MYAYNFVKTTGASQASELNLEMVSVVGPEDVDITCIIPELPHEAPYYRFHISKKGLGESTHQLAIQRAIQHGAMNALEEMKKHVLISAELEKTILGEITEPPDTSGMLIILHDSDCTKQFFAFAQSFYPRLNVVSEQNFYGAFFLDTICSVQGGCCYICYYT